MAAVFFDKALLPQGWATDVRIVFGADGAIDTVETGARAQFGDDIAAIGLPGVANLHSHAFQRGMAGLAEVRGPGSDSFWTWRDVMYRFLDRIGPDDLEAIAAQAYVEMLESGFTRVGEFHYLHHDIGGALFADLAENAVRIVAAAQQTGIGLSLLPVFYAHGGFGRQPTGPGQARFVNDLDRFARLLEASRSAVSLVPGGLVGIAPHSLRAVAADEFEPLIALAGGAPIHIHVAEQLKEVDESVAFSKARPVEWLLANQPVDGRWCLIHATHMTAAETADVAASGAVVGLCPITEANLGDGVFDGPAYLDAGGRYGVGSDSNVLIDLPGELRMLEYSQRLQLRARNVLAGPQGASTGRALFDAALAGGHQAVGLSQPGLAPGGRADFVSLDPEHPALCGRGGDSILDAFIFAARAGMVDAVWCAGNKVVAEGRHVERADVGRRFQQVMKRLLTQ